jgi:hypothetical protein
MNKAKITELITNNEHSEALQMMLQYTQSHTPQYANEVNTHIQKLNNLENDNRIGVISRDEFQRDMAKLTMAMLGLLDKIEKNEPVKNDSNPPKQGGVNIGNIKITGGNVQIADIINNIKKD